MNRRRKRLSVFALLLVFFMLGGITFPASGQTGYFVGEAEAYYEALKERMSKFGLELESSKSKIIKFGKYAEQ